jgi:hypothetical protein
MASCVALSSQHLCRLHPLRPLPPMRPTRFPARTSTRSPISFALASRDSAPSGYSPGNPPPSSTKPARPCPKPTSCLYRPGNPVCTAPLFHLYSQPLLYLAFANPGPPPSLQAISRGPLRKTADRRRRRLPPPVGNHCPCLRPHPLHSRLHHRRLVRNLWAAPAGQDPTERAYGGSGSITSTPLRRLPAASGV